MISIEDLTYKQLVEGIAVNLYGYKRIKKGEWVRYGCGFSAENENGETGIRLVTDTWYRDGYSSRFPMTYGTFNIITKMKTLGYGYILGTVPDGIRCTFYKPRDGAVCVEKYTSVSKSENRSVLESALKSTRKGDI